MLRFAAAVVFVALLAAPAWADGPIATGNPSAPPPPTSTDTPAPLPSQSAAATPPPAQTVMGPCGPEKLGADGKPDQSAHGEVTGGVGTGGYHELSGQVCKPVDGGYIEVGAGTAGAGGYGPAGGPTRRP